MKKQFIAYLVRAFSLSTNIHALNIKLLSILFGVKKQMTVATKNKQESSIKYSHQIMAILFMQLLAINAHAQWTKLNSGTTLDLNEITFPVADTGYIVGAKGTILKTTNGGQNWINLNPNVQVNFNDLYFKNANEGWIVGDSGTVCHTVNGGEIWSCKFMDSAAFINLNAVYPITNANILVGGNNTISEGYIYKTTDGGLSWKKANVEKYIWSVDILKIGMINANTGYAISRGMVLKTINGGMDWHITDTASVNAFSMYSIIEDIAYFPNSDTLYVCGWYPAYFGRTVNAGKNWTHTYTHDYYSLDFLNSKTGYVGGWGSIYKTTDAGLTFIDASGGSALLFSNIVSLDFSDEKTGYACGKNGIIIKTSNGGATAINENMREQTIVTMFPNPTSDKINFSKKVNVTVLNLSGKMVVKEENVTEIYLSDEPAGIYLIVVTDNDNHILYHHKLVKN